MAQGPDNTPLGDSIGEIIDRTTKIVHEEIELAKAEVTVALQDLLRGSVAGIVGGVFAFFGTFILLIAFSFLVADAVGTWYPWLGFFIVAFLCFIVGGLLAFVALKKIKKGSQLTPVQAIDEAKQTRSALQVEPAETIESTAVEEPVVEAEPVVPAVAAPVQPATLAGADRVAELSEVDQAQEDAVELELDAKAAKRRAKQEAKEAKAAAKAAKKAEDEAAKAARKADNEAAKAEAVAKKEAERAEKAAAKERAKAEKAAAKQAKKRGSAESEQPTADQPPLAQPPLAQQPEAPEQQPYVPPQPPPPPSDPTGGQ